MTDLCSPNSGDDVIPAAATPRLAVRGGGQFPVHRIYCVGRNFAEHAREMGAPAPVSRDERGTPVLFMKPADAVFTGQVLPYPPATTELHHEVELVVALGHHAPPGELPPDQALALVLGYTVGLDLTRRDLQAQAKAKGLPWDTAKGFDHSAPVGELVPAAQVDVLEQRVLELRVNGQLRQRAPLSDLIWNVAEILHELSRFYALRAGDLVFMGTPAGVAALQPGDIYEASLEGVVTLHGRVDA